GGVEAHPCGGGQERGIRGPLDARRAGDRLQRRDLRRGQRLPQRDRRLPRNPAPAGTARRHLVPRPERDAGTRAEPRDRSRLRGLSPPQRRRLRAREFAALALLSLAIETPLIAAPAFARVNSSGNLERLGPRLRGDERILSSSTGSERPLALRWREALTRGRRRWQDIHKRCSAMRWRWRAISGWSRRGISSSSSARGRNSSCPRPTHTFSRSW